MAAVRGVSSGPSCCRPLRSTSSHGSKGSGAGPPSPHPNRVEALTLGGQQEGGVVAPHPEQGGGGWGSWVGAKKGGGLRLWLVAGPSCPQQSACSPAQGACFLGVRLSVRGQKSPAEVATAGGGATAQACLAAGTPCYRAAPLGVGGSVSGRLDGHAVGQQATAPLL